jgi:hypothetical protein
MRVLLAFHMLAALSHTVAAEPNPGLRREISPGDSLQLDLAVGGLQHPAVLSKSILSLGLLSLQDVRLLNAPEQLELVKSLRDAGISLGSRSKLRRLSDSVHYTSRDCRQVVSSVDEKAPSDVRSSGQPVARSRLQERAAENFESSGLSADTIALAVTAIIGIGSFVVQARVSKAADANQREIERAHAARDKEGALAAIQADRVRGQMTDALMPMITLCATQSSAPSTCSASTSCPMHHNR